MRYLLIIILLVAVVMTAGCIGGNKETVVTPTPSIIYVTVTPTPQSSDPFVGKWEFTTFSGRIDNQFTINEDGSYTHLKSDGTTTYGKWRLNTTDQGTNQYTLIDNNVGLLTSFFYTSTNDTVYIKGYCFHDKDYNENYYRPGKNPVLPNIYSSEPIVGTWETKKWERYNIPQKKDWIQTYIFKPDGTFYMINELNLESDGYWRKINDNQYKIAYITACDEDDEPLVYTSQTNTLTQYDVNKIPITFRRSYSTPNIQKTVTPTQSSFSGQTHLSGFGDDVRSFTATGTGLRIFTMRHTGSSNFAIVLKDNSGNWVALLANEIGSYSGEKSEQLTSGTYYLDITADGSWTIDISSV